jgi:regulator of protease activity HflC (stomatin/prohibitin superfamily)
LQTCSVGTWKPEALAEKAEAMARAQREQAAALKQALATGDMEVAVSARNKMWEALYAMFSESFVLAQAWNDLTSRLASDERGG